MKGALSITVDKNGKVIIESIANRTEVEVTELESEAVKIIADIIGDVELERRTDSYLTVLNQEGNDFCRLKITERTMWFSFDMNPDIMPQYVSDPRLDSVKNKNQRHWKVKLSCVDELKDYMDIIEASSKIVY